MSDEASKHEFVYVLLALEAEMISDAEFISVVREWNKQGSASLRQLCQDRDLIGQAEHAALSQLVSQRLAKHSQDIDTCLGSVEISANVREELSRIDHPTVQTPLEHDKSMAETASIAAAHRDVVDETVAMGERRYTQSDHATQLPRFERIRPHARGGLGEVFVALDRELGREVAFKQIRKRYVDDGTSRQRFQFEAEVTGQLEHPGIVPIYSAGTDEGGAPYYAMRFIQGDSLQDEIKRFHEEDQADPRARSIGLRRLINQLLNASHAVAYAHSRGVLHRDIKPQNLMVGSFNETFVVDWGLAKRFQETDRAANLANATEAESTHPEVTAPGAVAGTPAFMSPEQADGALDRLGEASDVYSLGATLFSILTGERAFPQKDAIEVLEKVRSGDFQPPIKISRDMPRPLNAICLKAMAHDASDRYESATELGKDLERWLAGEPVLAWREPWAVRARRWMNRHRTLVVASVATTLVAAVGLIAVVAIQNKANQDLAVANNALKRTNKELTRTGNELADTNDMLSKSNDELGQANRDLAIARDRAQARSALAIQAIESIYLSVNDNLDVKNRPDLAAVRDAIIETPRSFFEEFKSELLSSDDTSPETRFRLAEVYHQLGNLSYMVSSQEGALQTYQQAIAILEELVSEEPDRHESRALLAKIHSQLGGMYLELSDYGVAFEQYAIAIGMYEVLLGDNPNDNKSKEGIGIARYNQSKIRVQNGELDEAISLAEQGRDVLLEVDDESPEIDAANNALLRLSDILGTAYFEKGELQIARGVLEETLPLAEQAVADNPTDVNSRQTLAFHHGRLWPVYAGLREPELAKESIRTALAIHQELANELPSNSQILLNLAELKSTWANVLLSSGDFHEGMAFLIDATVLGEQLVEKHPTNGRYKAMLNQFMLSLGSRYYSMGEKDKSIETFRKLIPLQEGLLASNPIDAPRRRDLAGLHYNIGYLLADVGRIEESLEAYHVALEMRQELAAEFPDQPKFRNDVAQTLGNIAGLHERRDEHDAALELLLEAQVIQENLVQDFPDQRDYQVVLARMLGSIASFLAVEGRDDEALGFYHRALDVLLPLVEADPTNSQQRRDLGNIYLLIGKHHFARREYDDAGLALVQGREIFEVLLDDQPDDGINRQELARFLSEQTRYFVQQGQLLEAIETADNAIELVESLLAANANDHSALRVIRVACLARAEAYARRGELEQARADWTRSIESLDENESPLDERPLGEAWIALWSENFELLKTEIDALLSHDASPRQMFIAARLLALASMTEDADDEFQSALSDQAMDVLLQLKQEHSLTVEQLAALRDGFAFSSIRSREDYPNLLE